MEERKRDKLTNSREKHRQKMDLQVEINVIDSIAALNGRYSVLKKALRPAETPGDVLVAKTCADAVKLLTRNRIGEAAEVKLSLGQPPRHSLPFFFQRIDLESIEIF